MLLQLLLLLPSCAKEGFPPGGPEDKDPPDVVSTVPDQGSVEVGTGQTVVLRFSEPMDHNSVERALFFTPDIGYLLRPRWRGEDLQLIPRQALRPNTTYVITLGADATDIRRNRLGRSVTLAFSTGPTLDDAYVDGRVLESGRPVAGAWVWFYPADEPEEMERADPRLVLPGAEPFTPPLYVKQTDANGRFEAPHLAAGTYRVFAFRDADGNRRWNPASDPLAVAPTDVRFEREDDRFERLILAVAPRDTTGPAPRTASAASSRVVQIRLTEAAVTTRPIRLTIEPFVDPEESGAVEQAAAPAGPVQVMAVYVPVDAPTSIVALVEGLQSGRRYQVRLAEAWDVIGNPASEPVRPVTFAASAQADTAQPRLTRLSPADSTRSLNRDTRLLFTFGAAVDTAGLGAWRLLGPDTLATRMTWRDLSTMELRPLGDPTQDVWYRLEAPLPALRSWTGTSTEIWEKAPAWRGTRPPGQGFLTIQVEGDALLSGGAYRVILEGVTSGATPRTLLQADMPGRLTTPLLAEGGYLIWGYADTDGDGIVGTGSVRPWRPAERVAAIADTQYVRERFESVVATPLDLRGMRRVERSAAVPDTGIVQQPPPTDGSPPGRRP